jgi:Sulfotransferase family
VSELSEAGVPGDSQAPVFVLCAARSGSTLLRFLLDAHPELACPPETKLPAMCTQLAGVWSLLEGTALPGGVTDPDMIPESAVAGMRRTLDDMTGSYLQRKGKRRFCDKSLGTAQHVRLLLRLYPNAKFICLYRHPMDMIASGIEACPWGLTGFGFEPYAAMSPGNSVQALAQFWADNMSAILAVEERFGERCHRVRYEDLVTDPETVADGIFRFVGVAAAPGISRACFSPDRDPFGPADYKIWLTTEITPDSVGRGWAVPATPIRANLREAINGMARKLGYVQVGERWGAAASVPDLRLPGTGPLADAPATRREASTLLQLGHRMLVARLEAGLAAIGDTFIDRWGQYGAETFLLASTPPGGSGMWIRWRVDLAARTLDVVAGVPAADNVAARWEIIGSSSTWEKIINRDLNLSVAIRRRDVRYADTGDGAPARPRVRLSMLADLLGVTVWQSADDTAADEAAAPEVGQLTA